MKKPTIISLGGSVIVPDEEDLINISFLKKFRKFILENLKKEKNFVIVVGGGKITRIYQKAAKKITNIEAEDIDWLGVHSTKLNAYLLQAIFRDQAYPVILDNPEKPLKKTKKRLFIASGWKPGWSTDYIAVRLAQRFKVKEIINATNINYVYTKNPEKFKEAIPIKKISFKEYQRLIPKKWFPGMSLPFDPVATKLARKLKLKVKIIKAEDLKNFEKAIEGKEFKGTVIY